MMGGPLLYMFMEVHPTRYLPVAVGVGSVGSGVGVVVGRVRLFRMCFASPQKEGADGMAKYSFAGYACLLVLSAVRTHARHQSEVP